MIITVITGIYTISGGLKAVVVTETIQSVVLIIGAAAITCFALAALPEHGIRSLGELEAALKPDQLSMLHADNRMGLAWYAVLLGYTVNGIWYWCTDQTIVQRVLGARSEWDAQQGAILAGFLKILPVFIMVLPGVAAYVLFRDLIGENANQTLPVLITQLIPSGMKGLISAALLAALMSTIASALNSCGTLFAVDIFTRLRPKNLRPAAGEGRTNQRRRHHGAGDDPGPRRADVTRASSRRSTPSRPTCRRRLPPSSCGASSGAGALSRRRWRR